MDARRKFGEHERSVWVKWGSTVLSVFVGWTQAGDLILTHGCAAVEMYRCMLRPIKKSARKCASYVQFFFWHPIILLLALYSNFPTFFPSLCGLFSFLLLPNLFGPHFLPLQSSSFSLPMIFFRFCLFCTPFSPFPSPFLLSISFIFGTKSSCLV